MNHNTKNASKIKTLGAALIAVCALQTSAAVAETITHRVEVPMSHSNWEAVLDVPKFDAAVGVLASVEVRATAVGSSCTKIENRSGLARLVVSGSDLVVQVANSSGLVLNEVRPSIRHENRLTRYDGKSDCGGTSGVTNPAKHVSASKNVAFASGDFDLADFQGVGQVELKATARAVGFYSGSAAATFNVETKASLAVEVVYTYEPLVIAADEALGTIGSRVWKDKDEDGIQEVNENGLKGWLVELRSGGTVIASVETGNDGEYGFTDVPAGVYTVKVTAKKGYRGTSDLDGNATPGEAVIEVLPGQAIENADFGFVKNSGTDNNDDDRDDDDDQDDDDCDDDDDDDKKGKGRK